MTGPEELGEIAAWLEFTGKQLDGEMQRASACGSHGLVAYLQGRAAQLALVEHEVEARRKRYWRTTKGAEGGNS